MKAAVLHEFKKPLCIEDVPVPNAGPNEILLKVEACGVCHSDLHIAEGDWPELAGIIKRPLILGHEVVGRIVGIGDAVREFRVGDRVGVPWIHWTCGQCESCLEGKENLCHAQMVTGVTVDGGYAEFLKAKASHVMRVPDEIGFEEAAPLFCAGVTAYRAVRNAGVQAKQRAAVFGIGGVGQFVLQIVRLFQAEVVAVDIARDQLEVAEALGASQTIDARATSATNRLQTLGGLHVAVVTSASKAAYEMAVSSLRPGGTLVVVGLPAEDLTLSPVKMVTRELRIVSSCVGTREDLRGLLDLAAAGRIRCRVEPCPLEKINEVFARMRQGQLTGRVVLSLNHGGCP